MEKAKKSWPCWIFLASDWWRRVSDVIAKVKMGELSCQKSPYKGVTI